MAAVDPGGPSPPSVEDAGAVNGGALEGLGDGDGNDTWENPTVSDGFAPKMALGFPDRREERSRCGLIRFKLENGVPDVGGLGWRSRAGHLLKNQTFFASKPGENQWNNPTHAGWAATPHLSSFGVGPCLPKWASKNQGIGMASSIQNMFNHWSFDVNQVKQVNQMVLNHLTIIEPSTNYHTMNHHITLLSHC